MINFKRASVKNALNRLIRCLFAEGYLKYSLIEMQDNYYIYPINGESKIVFTNLSLFDTQVVQNNGMVYLEGPDRERRKISSPSELFSVIEEGISFDVSKDSISSILSDIDNSINNDALARQYRQKWARRLACKLDSTEKKSIIWLAFNHYSKRDASILLDQWGSLEGHPFYPTWKSKPGLDEKSVVELSPEFDAVTDIVFTALHKERACLEWMPEVGDIIKWHKHNFPNIWHDWIKNLECIGLNPSDYLPLPVHGWHLRNFVKEHFKNDIEQRMFVIDGAPVLMARPTMSFRTMMPCFPDGRVIPNMPFIKLPVAIWLTSEWRSLQAKSIHMGPRLSHVISKIIRLDNFFDNKLEIFVEPLGIIRAEEGNDHSFVATELGVCSLGKGDTHKGRFLSVVYRDAATLDRNDQLLPVPVASLLVAGLDGKTPVVAELVEMGGGKEQVLLFWQQYLKVVLQPCIAMYLCYGIAFEAHQQNCIILFDKKGMAQKLLIKDFGDGRTYSPLLEDRGYYLAPFTRDGILPTTFNDDISLVRSFVIDACLICHLNELAMLLTKHYHLENKIAWKMMAKEVDCIFNLMKKRLPHDFWQREYDAFIKLPWKTRSVLRMHLEKYADYRIEHDMENPLKQWIV